MVRIIMRRLGIVIALMGAAFAVPAAAQFFSDGYEFLKAVKRRNASARFGFITSQATLVMKQEAKKAGALFLISKPFTPENFKDHLDPYLS